MSIESYKEVITAFTNAGIALVPMAWGKKGPTAKHWQDEACAYKSLEDFGNQLKDSNLGMLHRWSGTCAVDIDDLELAHEWLLKHDVDLKGLLAAKDAVLITSPASNRGKLLYRMPVGAEATVQLQINTNYKEIHGVDDKKREAVIDFRCGNKQGTTVQDVIYGAHPNKAGIIDGMYGVSGDITAIPDIPDTLLTVWEDINTEKEERVEQRNAGAFKEMSEAQEEEVYKMLQCIPADINRKDWMTVCYAIVSMQSPVGWDLFNMWSQQSSKYNEREAKRLYKNAKPHGGVTVGSLCRLAKQHGYEYKTLKQELTEAQEAERQAALTVKIIEEVLRKKQK